MEYVGVRAFIQARTTSERFPGKVLAPFRGLALIEHVISAARRVLGPEHVVVLTSSDPSDLALRLLVKERMVGCFAGSLDDVFGRFCGALQEFPCEWFLRLTADSPLLSPDVVRRLLLPPSRVSLPDYISNCHPERLAPAGQSVELVRAEAFLSIDPSTLDHYDREHVTSVFYRDPEERFRIEQVDCRDMGWPCEDMEVNTVEDLKRLEALKWP